LLNQYVHIRVSGHADFSGEELSTHSTSEQTKEEGNIQPK
jgi:hypothetical protein